MRASELEVAYSETETAMGDKSFREPDELFPKTRWSLVAQSRDAEAAGKALAELCEIYWYPVYAFFRCKGKTHHDAEDLVQDFIASLLRKGTFEKAEQHRGKLREYLLFAAKRFGISADRKETRLKRGGGTIPISLDVERAKNKFEAEPVGNETPETHFEKCWGTAVLGETMKALKAKYEDRGDSELLDAMLPYIMRNETDQERQEKVARRIGKSVNAFRMSLTRMRQNYHEILRATLLDTLEDPSEVEEEMRHLRAIFDRDRVIS